MGGPQVPRGRRPGRLIRLGMRILGASVAPLAYRGDTCHVVVVVDNTLLCFQRSSKLLRVLPRKSPFPPTGYHARPPTVALPGPCGPAGAPSECCRDKTSPWAVRRPPPLHAVAEAVERQAHGSAFPPLCGPPAQPRRVFTVVYIMSERQRASVVRPAVAGVTGAEAPAPPPHTSAYRTVHSEFLPKFSRIYQHLSSPPTCRRLPLSRHRRPGRLQRPCHRHTSPAAAANLRAGPHP